MSSEELARVLHSYGILRKDQGKKNEKKRKLKEIMEKGYQLLPYREWTNQDEEDLTKLKETKVDMKDITLLRQEESKWLDYKAVLGMMNE